MFDQLTGDDRGHRSDVVNPNHVDLKSSGDITNSTESHPLPNLANFLHLLLNGETIVASGGMATVYVPPLQAKTTLQLDGFTAFCRSLARNGKPDLDADFGEYVKLQVWGVDVQATAKRLDVNADAGVY